MGYFKVWLENSEQEDVRKTIAKLPKRHQALVRGYQITFEGGNTMKGDKEHIGLIQDSPVKKIIIAAPFRFGREYTLLHEIGHLVWATFMTPDLKKRWSHVARQNKTENPQNDEEEFCMSYAQHFANNKLLKYHLPVRDRFMKSLIDSTG